MDSRDLHTLLAVGEAGSLSGAAARLGLAVSTVARRVEALEASLRLTLLDRRADGARLTPDGVAIARLATPMVEQAARIARQADALRAGGRGTPVRVSATEIIVADILAPALPALWASHPSVAVTLLTEARVVSLAGREAELAIRMARPEGASLFARRLPEVRLAFFAGPAYLAGRDPARLDLTRECLLAFDDSFGPIPEVEVLRGLGLDPAVRMRTGSSRALLAAVQAGAGIALLPEGAAARAGLVKVPAPALPPPRTPWLVLHRDLRRDPAVRAVQRWVLGCFLQRAEAPIPPAPP